MEPNLTEHLRTMIKAIEETERKLLDTKELSADDIVTLFKRQVENEQAMGWIGNLTKKYPGKIVNPRQGGGKIIGLPESK